MSQTPCTLGLLRSSPHTIGSSRQLTLQRVLLVALALASSVTSRGALGMRSESAGGLAAREAEAAAAGRPTRVFRVEHEGVVTESLFDPHAFAEHAGWPWHTPTKQRLRDPSAFDGSSLSKAHAGVSFLRPDFPRRSGERPVTHDQCPHGMLTQQTPADLLEEFKTQAVARLGQREGVAVTHQSVVSLQTTSPCFVLKAGIPLPRGLSNSHHAREFAHIHATYNPQWGWSARQGGGGGSQHTTLAPADCKKLVELGWAEWHPVASSGHTVVLVYAPRNQEEVKLCLEVLDAAAEFFTRGH